ncbi:MAG: hypothetical protein CMP97_00865 [Gammaproteobacteria bacterium]|jgi:hypothetical protein|nr:hypothetical protein [Gammaproteobacteria bacterium]
MKMDWRIFMGLSLTSIWLITGFIYVSSSVGWAGFVNLPVEEVGSFLEGAFAPLAFLWLVIGYFLQQQELIQNTQAMRAQANEIARTAEQAIIQSEKLAASETYARQEATLRLAETVRHQLGGISGMLYISSHGPLADYPSGEINSEQMFSEQSKGDPEIFSRKLLEISFALGETTKQFELFYKTEIRARHTNQFIFVFERLMNHVRHSDTDNMLFDSLSGNAHGLLYARMKGHQANAPEQWSDHSKTARTVNV